MKVYFERRILLGCIVAFAILASLGIYTYRYFKESTVTTRQVTHTNEVLYHVEQLYSAALRLEVGLYQFIETGDTSFASFYRGELRMAAEHTRILGALVHDNPAQLRTLDSMRMTGRKKVKFIQEVMLARSQSVLAARRLVPSAANDAITKELTAAIMQMQQREKVLLQHRTEASVLGESKFMRTFLLMQFSGAVILVLVFYAIHASFRRRVLAEQSLREVSEEIRDLYNNAPCGYHSLNAEGYISEMNNMWLQWLGYTRDEIVGKKRFIDLLTAESKSLFENNFEKFKTTGSVSNLEFNLVRKNGEGLPVILNSTAVKNEQGDFVRSRSTVFNLTERKKSEAKIMQLNNELEAFTYSVSHDLRAPLRSIDGYARILKEDYGPKLDPEANRVIDIVVRNARRMGKLIDDLLDFSRVGRKELSHSRVDFNTMVNNLRRELMEQEKERVINFVVHPLALVEGDNNMLRQVWENLISNALKYSSKKPLTEIEITCTTEEDKTIYSIRDNGVGFDMKYANKLFGVFQRLHKVQDFEGTGVGLALVHRIISRHGGKIWAEAAVDAGATFSFYIPSETR
ncbi:sensor histidine kinase [Chryseolinea lacunae]|uniref:histidine kinase n=1 Tax=Chryseolinea lacunae TaxID=2801331 RepID=A0ABS1KLL6_9BACT|nr:ATP-binding protein [Chryseolinea lacunae]MBL0740224.1 CHASE3 domain-containing protein [Chryseolinea lacunae]